MLDLKISPTENPIGFRRHARDNLFLYGLCPIFIRRLSHDFDKMVLNVAVDARCIERDRLFQALQVGY